MPNELRDTRVLVTGGAGFIGSELTRQISAQGAFVTVADNLANGRRENLEPILGDRCRLALADIRDEQTMAGLVRDADVIFHLACLGVRHSIHSPVENHAVNATATLNLLVLARAAGIRRFVHVSSSEVYGTALWAPMTEEHPTIPNTIYGASKLAGECYARAYHRSFGFPAVVIRPFNTYGPRCHHEGDSGEVIPKFLLRTMAGRPMVVFGDGTQTRDFTYVSDTARGILLAGWADKAIGETINLGSGQELSINEVARQVAATAERPDAQILHDPPRPGDVLRLCADSAKARTLLDFEPVVPFKTGLASLKEWYLSLGRPVEALLEQEVVHNWLPTKAETNAYAGEIA